MLVVKPSDTSLPRRSRRFDSSHRFGNVAMTGVAAQNANVPQRHSKSYQNAGGEEVCYFVNHKAVGSNPAGRCKPAVAQWESM
jgi:hypothetical protein